MRSLVFLALLLTTGAEAAGPEVCLPRPPAEDFPLPAAKACAPESAPTADRLRPELSGACGKVHRRALDAAGAAWARELEPRTGKLYGPLAKEPLERRVLALWNQDQAGKAACVRSPHLELCDPELRQQWLASLLDGDDRLVVRVRELFTWYVQAQAACEQLASQWSEPAVKQLASHRRTFSGSFKRLFPGPSGESEAGRRLTELHRLHGSAALAPNTVRAWGAGLESWERTLARRRPKAEPKKAPKRRKAAPAEVAPPAD